MSVLMRRGNETIVARTRHVPNLEAQGWQVVGDEPDHEPVPEPDPEDSFDPEPEAEPDGVPKLNASRAAWRDYALSQGVDPEGMNRKQIQQTLGIKK